MGDFYYKENTFNGLSVRDCPLSPSFRHFWWSWSSDGLSYYLFVIQKTAVPDTNASSTIILRILLGRWYRRYNFCSCNALDYCSTLAHSSYHKEESKGLRYKPWNRNNFHFINLLEKHSLVIRECFFYFEMQQSKLRAVKACLILSHLSQNNFERYIWQMHKNVFCICLKSQRYPTEEKILTCLKNNDIIQLKSM